MKTVNMYGVVGMLALAFAGSAIADQSTLDQNIARRAAAVPSVEKADQAWEGASLQTATEQQQLRKLSNLQYLSKRAYQVSAASE